MKFTIIINPKYKELQEFVWQIPEVFVSIPHIIQAKRNIIKQAEVNKLSLNIKRYRKPIFINRIVYTFFRKPKAYKAYYNALEVIARGFHTPEPIAYIENKENGLLSLSYFVSIQLTHMREIRDYYFSKADIEDKSLLEAFALYTAKLHNANILHLDYSPGNILISVEKNNSYTFSLVDINRMQFHPVSLEEGCRNFCRLFEYNEVIEFIAPIYAKYRNADAKLCLKLMLYYKKQFEYKKERKRKLKKMIGKG